MNAPTKATVSEITLGFKIYLKYFPSFPFVANVNFFNNGMNQLVASNRSVSFTNYNKIKTAKPRIYSKLFNGCIPTTGI